MIQSYYTTIKRIFDVSFGQNRMISVYIVNIRNY